MDKTENIPINIKPFHLVKVTNMGNTRSIQYLAKKNSKQTIIKINKEEYVEKNTGEIKKFKHTSNRSDNKKSLQSTMKKLRELINTNFVGANNELFITLTYANEMNDEKQLSKDFNLFMKRLQNNYKDKKINYIRVNEPQSRMLDGKPVWHIHCLLKGINYIDNTFLKEKVWKHGFVNIKSMKKIDNIGAYLTSYLTNMPLDEVNKDDLERNSEIVKKNDKKYIKGARLKYYPPGMNFYSSSKGIKRPTSYYTIYDDLDLSTFGTLTNHYVAKIKTDEFSSLIIKDEYNIKRSN